MPTLSDFTSLIMSPQDKPLYKEAVQSAGVGAKRGAYILLWLSCAESLKRKFKEASIRDTLAHTIINEIETIETERRSADLLILEKAKVYGFLNDVDYQKLTHIYSMRCVYGHPYETAPTDEELAAAASTVVTLVLSKPVLLRKQYVETLIGQLMGNVDYLEDSKEGVGEFAADVCARIDPSFYKKLLSMYSYELEKVYSDPTLSMLVRRGYWFILEFLSDCGTAFINESDWHEYAIAFPKFSELLFLGEPSLYEAVGQRARNSVISHALNNAANRPKGIKRLEPLRLSGALSPPQAKAYDLIDLSTVKAAGLKVSTAYTQIIDGLKSHNWPTQNMAMDVIWLNERSDMAQLDVSQQDNLGRNILQASDGLAARAISYLETISSNSLNVPNAVIKGIIFESFVNESGIFRLKKRGINVITGLMAAHPQIINELVVKIDGSQPKTSTWQSEYDEVLGMLTLGGNLSTLIECLNRNHDRLGISDPNLDDIPF